VPLKKITFSMTIDAPQLFAALTQLGADVEVAFNGDVPRAKRHKRAQEQFLPSPKRLQITDQSKPKTRDVVLAAIKENPGAIPGAIVVAVQKILPDKSAPAIYQHMKLLRMKGLVASKDGQYTITARGAK